MSPLTIIYHFHSSSSQDEEFKSASYQMVYVFNEEAMTEASVLLELLKAYPDSNFQDKTFLNLDDLKAFAKRLAEELDAPQVRIISAQDYNIGIDGAKDLKSFKDIFSKYGELLINESRMKKKNFFGKLFS
jgi:hypothetical protein